MESRGLMKVNDRGEISLRGDKNINPPLATIGGACTPWGRFHRKYVVARYELVHKGFARRRHPFETYGVSLASRLFFARENNV